MKIPWVTSGSLIRTVDGEVGPVGSPGAGLVAGQALVAPLVPLLGLHHEQSPLLHQQSAREDVDDDI